MTETVGLLFVMAAGIFVAWTGVRADKVLVRNRWERLGLIVLGCCAIIVAATFLTGVV